MKSIRYILFSFAIGLIVASCDKAVDIPLPESEPYVAIDAWVTNRMEVQEISVAMTRPYLNNGEIPVVEDATVLLINESKSDTMSFVFSTQRQKYIWDPNVEGDSIGSVGDRFRLKIDYQGITYEAETELYRVPAIDSITFEYIADDVFSGEKDFYLGDFWSLDPLGSGDTYWIKSYKNGVYLNQPDELNYAWDAAFSEGAEFDNKQFIQPIRNMMNPFTEDETEEITLEPAYDVGDTAYVEIHSISNDAWFFISRVYTETSREGGFGALFATPLADVPTNITPSNDGVEVVGFFNVAAVSSREQVVDDSSIRDNIQD